ncbi:MAG: class I SAM-dependent methyltransferase [Acidobacteria bacterium]|nr:class I SAM-dependent methyltransferase [Acidobacteriota bacterium]MCB9397694.1 class I SAM-dependent methyltransferase [Acidobacteriota bacterium]
MTDLQQGFDAIALDYDRQFNERPVTQAMRTTVHRWYRHFLRPGQKVLDVACGPGPDLAFLLGLGLEVCAIDQSPEMVKRAQSLFPTALYHVMDYNQIGQLKGPFDAICANFGGLNTQAQFEDWAQVCFDLLQPQGLLFLNIMTQFCLSEFVFRCLQLKRPHLRGKKPRTLQVGGFPIETWYFNPYSWYRSAFAKGFDLVLVQGQGVLLPPPAFPLQPKALIRLLSGPDRILGRCYPFNQWGDHALLILRKRQ